LLRCPGSVRNSWERRRESWERRRGVEPKKGFKVFTKWWSPKWVIAFSLRAFSKLFNYICN
jgi:hypothetical protein